MSAPAPGSPSPPPGHSSPDSGYVPTTRHDEPPAPSVTPRSGPPRIPPPGLRPAAHPHPPAGSGGSESVAHVSGGKRVEQEIQERLAEIAQFTVATGDRDGFGPKDERPPDYPVSGYVLEGPIDAGTYGSVWKAHSGDDEQRTVAIKFFPRRQGSVREINNDTKHLKRLTNENGFVQLLDINTAAEWPYFVMSYAERSLQGEIKEGGPLGVHEANRLFTKLVAAMAHAHAKKPGLCHCDLKPSNVLLSEQRDPLVSDFGQSRLLDDRDRAALGTFFFMPPEQADMGKETPDSRWDVYALGAIFYQMVNPTRLPPRMDGWDKAGSVTASKKLITRLTAYREHLLAAPKPTAHRSAPGMDGRLADVIDRCLDLNPGRRYPDAGAILEALRRRRTARRRTPILRLGAIASLVALIGAVAAGLYFGRDVVEKHREELVRHIQVGQKETAYIAARLFEEKLQQRINFLEQVVPAKGATTANAGPTFDAARTAMAAAINSLERNNGQLPFSTLWLAEDRKGVDDWLLEITKRASVERVFDKRGMSVTLNAKGYAYLYSRTEPAPEAGKWSIRNPWKNREAVQIYSKNFSWRDWFSRSAYKLSDDTDGDKPHAPVTDTHISLAYLSKPEQQWAIGVSRPIYGGRPSAGAEEVLALLTGGIDMGSELVNWMGEIKGDKVRGVGGKSTLLVLNDRDFLIWRPELHSLVAGGAGGKVVVPTPAQEKEMYTRLELYTDWRGRYFTEGKAGSKQGNFNDPWVGDDAQAERGRHLATYEPFYPLGRGVGREEPWYVVVEQSEAEALGPVSDLQHNLLAKGIWAGGIFLAVAGALWGGVFWMLRRTEGATDG